MATQKGNTKESLAKRRVITPSAILSYPWLFEPSTGPKGDQKPMYSAQLVFKPGTDLKALKDAAIFAGREKWGAKFDELVRAGKVRLPFRDDAEEKGYPAGSVFFNARSKNRPGVVSRIKGGDGKPTPITDSDEMYPGCIVRASVTAFAYDQQGNKGVSFGLNNVQKLEDGERLDNRMRAEDEFEADLSMEPASLDDLM